MDELFRALMNSERVSLPTRKVMACRDESLTLPANPACLSDAEFVTLVTVATLIVPQSQESTIDLAALVVRAKFLKRGNGWRFASMPPDHISLAMGLNLLEGSSKSRYKAEFAALDMGQQIELLKDVQGGGAGWKDLDSSLWFEELLSDAVEAYVSQPSTMAAMGFDGFAFLPRWQRIGLDTAETWEPSAK